MKIYKSFIINPISLDKTEYFENGALVIDNLGKILFCGDFKDIPEELALIEKHNYRDDFILPGLIDLHCHLPQYHAIASAKGELLEWLNEYIFPLEQKFSDSDYARANSELFFRNVIKAGTTTICVYCSNHESATDIAFQVAEKAGIRAFIGMTLMDRYGYNQLNCEENINSAKSLIDKWHLKNEKLQYIVTPRFAGSCSADLLKVSAKLSSEKSLFIQTHLSENHSELNFIKSIFPQSDSYTDVYYQNDLLTDSTILAHCIHLNNKELDILHKSEIVMAHCPTSNRYLQSGVMPLKNYLDYGFRIGLGSDVAGGYNLSILHEAKEAIESTKTFNIMNKQHSNALNSQEALYLATLGAAKSLKMDNKIGNFEVGKFADFIVIDGKDISSKDNPTSTNENILSKIIYSSESYKVKATYISGESLKS